MNERLQELAVQAKGFVDLNQHVGGEKGCMVYTYDGLEKFAELIVRECVNLCYDRAYRGTLGSFTDGAMICANEIKEHFGVEE